MSKNTTIPVISKECITRLVRDVKYIMNNPLIENGIYYSHDDEDMLKGYALIIGPSETPYFGGNYFFEFFYPTDYPHSPPKVIYHTNGQNIRFNPNLYTNGKVCVSTLNTWRGDQWTSCQTISTTLLTLCTLLCKNPILNEPGVTKIHADYNAYNEIITYKNIDIAILHMVNKHEGVYPMKFDMFYPYVKENFIKNALDMLKFLEKQIMEQAIIKQLSTHLYQMSNITIDYKTLYNKYKTALLLHVDQIDNKELMDLLNMPDAVATKEPAKKKRMVITPPLPDLETESVFIAANPIPVKVKGNVY